MTTTYEVVYFPGHGRAEPIRLLLALSGNPFSERHVGRADWPTLKREMPLAQVPVLIEHDDKGERMIPQTQAILRHLARSLGLYGKTEDEMLQVDIVAETAMDVGAGLAPLVFGPGRGNAEVQNKHRQEVWPAMAGRLAKLLAEAQSKAGYFVTSTPTLADVAVFHVLSTYQALWPTCLESQPTLQAFCTRMSSLPQLSAYLASRPESEAVGARAAELA